MPASVRVQIVLFETPPAACQRLLDALAACAHVARARGSASGVSVVFGDCTPAPCVGPDQRAGLADRAAGAELPLDWTVFGENLGHGAAQNRLARGGDEDVLVMVNPDAYPAPAALHELLACLADPGVGLAEGRQLPFETPRHVDPLSLDTPWCAGAMLAIRLPLFLDLGGFDEAFFLQGDDIDLSFRVRARGLRARYVPTATVFHARALDRSGYATSTVTEAFHIHLAELILAWKTQAGDQLDQLMERTDRDGQPWQKDANRAFRNLQARGALPEPYDFDARAFLAEYPRRRF